MPKADNKKRTKYSYALYGSEADMLRDLPDTDSHAIYHTMLSATKAAIEYLDGIRREDCNVVGYIVIVRNSNGKRVARLNVSAYHT